WTAIFSKELNVKASSFYSHADEWQGKKVKTFDLAIDLIASRKVDFGWMVNQQYRIEDFSRALKEIANRKKHPILKAVFSFE
ncbi:MAG: alcohol dehydrogenase, partial [Chloroflexota bacterium]